MARKTPGIYIAIRGDYSAFETDIFKAKQIAKAQAEDMAKSINNAVSKVDLTGGINKLTRELKTAQAALSAGAFKGQVSGLEEIAKAAGVSSKQLEGLTNSMLKSQAAATANRAFEYLQKNAGLSTLQLAKLRAELGDTSGALSTLASGAKANAVGILAFGAAAAMAGKQVLDASLQMDRLNKAYATITGSSSAAQNQLDYMYDVTQRLGLQFQGTAEAAKGFFAAGKDSALKDHLNGIFESVSMAGSALALSKDQMDGVFLALGQMISKGKVQAEELRGQLGERLPGAFDAAARAMGVTTAKLDDMLKKGQVTAEEMLPKLAKADDRDGQGVPFIVQVAVRVVPCRFDAHGDHPAHHRADCGRGVRDAWHGRRCVCGGGIRWFGRRWRDEQPFRPQQPYAGVVDVRGCGYHQQHDGRMVPRNVFQCDRSEFACGAGGSEQRVGRIRRRHEYGHGDGIQCACRWNRSAKRCPVHLPCFGRSLSWCCLS